MKAFILFVVVALCPVIFGQADSSSFVENNEQGIVMTGNLQQDNKTLFAAEQREVKIPLEMQSKRKPIVSGLFSLVVPGAGQLYNGNYTLTAVFVAIEAAAIYVGLKYDHKGDNQTDFFQNYANAHWNALRYADWTLKNAKYFANNSSFDESLWRDKVIPDGKNVNWDQLNNLERALGNVQDVGYSHVLPPYGVQQYYELIGKYPQFSHGWDEANPNDQDYHIIPSQLEWYANQRGKANDYYNVAAKAVIAIYLNHIASAIQAIWETSLQNKRLTAQASYEQMNFSGIAEYVPKLTVKYNF